MKKLLLINFPQGAPNNLFALLSFNEIALGILQEELKDITGTGVLMGNLSLSRITGLTIFLVSGSDDANLQAEMDAATNSRTQMARELREIQFPLLVPEENENDTLGVLSVNTTPDGFEFHGMEDVPLGEIPIEFNTLPINHNIFGLVPPRNFTPEEYKKVCAVFTREGNGSTQIAMGELLARLDDGMARKFVKGFRKECESALLAWEPRFGMGCRYREGM